MEAMLALVLVAAAADGLPLIQYADQQQRADAMAIIQLNAKTKQHNEKRCVREDLAALPLKCLKMKRMLT